MSTESFRQVMEDKLTLEERYGWKSSRDCQGFPPVGSIKSGVQPPYRYFTRPTVSIGTNKCEMGGVGYLEGLSILTIFSKTY